MSLFILNVISHTCFISMWMSYHDIDYSNESHIVDCLLSRGSSQNIKIPEFKNMLKFSLTSVFNYKFFFGILL